MTPSSCHMTCSVPSRIEEEWEQKNRGRLIKSVLQANRLVQEANMLADALHKDTLFKVTLTVPRSFLSPTQNVEASSETNEVAIRVLHKQRGTDSVWTTDTLEEKVLTMREMYERMEEGGSLLVGVVSSTLNLIIDVVYFRTSQLGRTHSMTWSNMPCWEWLISI